MGSAAAPKFGMNDRQTNAPKVGGVGYIGFWTERKSTFNINRIVFDAIGDASNFGLILLNSFLD
jgi:hypothetical protein